MVVDVCKKENSLALQFIFMRRNPVLVLVASLSCLVLCQSVCDKTKQQSIIAANNPIITGADQTEQYLSYLKGKRVAVLANPTTIIGKRHLVDSLLSLGVNIVKVFGPEHGFRGNASAGVKVKDENDPATGVPVISLYGPKRKPTKEDLANVDLMIFDIQDVGVRYYTYISSMHYLLEAAAEQGVAVLVLDRPNPNGAYVDGPVLEQPFQSFVGMHPIPLLHGMTVGELAQMIKGEGWINQAATLQLTVIPVSHYQRNLPYTLPVKPSPNLPNAQAIALYPSLGFFEATPLSIGRGTAFPFQVIGYDKFAIGNFQFTPVSTPGAAIAPPLMDKTVYGQDLRQTAAGGLNLSYLLQWHALFAQQNVRFFTAPGFMDKLAGTDKLRQQIEQGVSEQQIRHSWQADLVRFKQLRQPYLLYP